MVKKGFMQNMNPLTHMVNLSVQTETFPAHLKVTKVTPIVLKVDKRSGKNYRQV